MTPGVGGRSGRVTTGYEESVGAVTPHDGPGEEVSQGSGDVGRAARRTHSHRSWNSLGQDSDRF